MDPNQPSSSSFSKTFRLPNENCSHKSNQICSHCELPSTINETWEELLKNNRNKIIYLPDNSTTIFPTNVRNNLMIQNSFISSIINDETEDTTNTNSKYKKLLVRAAKIVAEIFSIDEILDKFTVIPNHVLELISFYAFPCDEHIRSYFFNILTIDSSEFENEQNRPNFLARYERGKHLFLHAAVFDVWQVGFTLNGFVSDYSDRNKQFYVEMNFQKCKITSISCTCLKIESWCEHLIALALHRIHKPNEMSLRMPNSINLLDLKLEQTRKMLQYLEIKYKATRPIQLLIDEFKKKESILNYIDAPDPSITLNFMKTPNWYLNKLEIKNTIAQWLSQFNLNEIYAIIINIKNLMKMEDLSALKLLKLLTQEYLNIKPIDIFDMKYIYSQFLWDAILNLWICIVNQSKMFNNHLKMRDRFIDWSKHENCPLDKDKNFIKIKPLNEKTELIRSSKERRYIFDRAIRATFLKWDNSVKYILENGPNFQNSDFPIWFKHLPTASVYVESLRLNGQTEEAVRLAMAIVQYIRSELNKINQNQYVEIISARNAWIGCPFNPIEVLFDTLIDACSEVRSILKDFNQFQFFYDFINNDNLIKTFSNYDHQNRPKHCQLKFKPPQTILDTDNYLTSALFIALVGLSQIRTMPETNILWERCSIQEHRIICKLLEIPLNVKMINTLKCHAEYLITNGVLSDTILNPLTNQVVPNNIIQIPGLVRFMFGALLINNPDLAFEIGLRSIRFVVFKNYMPNYSFIYRDDIFFQMQIELAITMLLSVKNNASRLKNLLDKIKTFITEPIFLTDLIKAFMRLMKKSFIDNQTAITILFEIGIHCAEIRKNDLNNQSDQFIIQFLAINLIEFGADNLKNLIVNWQKYFTPGEAVKYLFRKLLKKFKIKQIVDQTILTELINKSALDCIKHYPNKCLSEIFLLFKENNYSFYKFLDILEESASLNQIELDNIQYILYYFQDKFPNKIYQITVLVAKKLKIPNNYTIMHGSDDFLIWACYFAKNLSQSQLMDLMDVIIENVSSARLLTRIIKILLPENELEPNHYPLNDPLMLKLIIATKNAYMDFASSPLEDLEPEDYYNLIDYLNEAIEMISLAPDGQAQLEEYFNLLETKYKSNNSLWQMISKEFNLN